MNHISSYSPKIGNFATTGTLLMELAVKNFQQIIEMALQQLVQSSAIEAPLLKAIEYAVFPAGKRIRPLISLLLAHDLGIPSDLVLNKALALELLHCSSLVHDDLPALDNDDYRRGRPSCHKVFGEATAILAGDALIAMAFKLASKPSESQNYSADLLALYEIGEAFLAVCRGQQLDLLNYADLEKMQSLKTGALFACSVKLPAIYIDPSAELIQKFEAFGLELGAFFQHADDYLDIWGSNTARGRSQSSDLKNGKTTKVTGQDQVQALSDLVKTYSTLKESLNGLSSEFEKEVAKKIEFKGLNHIMNLIYSRLDRI